MEKMNDSELRRRENHGEFDNLDSDTTSVIAVDEKSPGIRRIEAITKAWNNVDRTWFIVALCLLTCELCQQSVIKTLANKQTPDCRSLPLDNMRSNVPVSVPLSSVHTKPRR